MSFAKLNQADRGCSVKWEEGTLKHKSNATASLRSVGGRIPTCVAELFIDLQRCQLCRSVSAFHLLY